MINNTNAQKLIRDISILQKSLEHIKKLSLGNGAFLIQCEITDGFIQNTSNGQFDLMNKDKGKYTFDELVADGQKQLAVVWSNSQSGSSEVNNYLYRHFLNGGYVNDKVAYTDAIHGKTQVGSYALCRMINFNGETISTNEASYNDFKSVRSIDTIEVEIESQNTYNQFDLTGDDKHNYIYMFPFWTGMKGFQMTSINFMSNINDTSNIGVSQIKKIRCTFECIDNKLQQSGRSIEEYLQLSLPGGFFAWPKIDFSTNTVSIDENYMVANGVKYVSEEIYNACIHSSSCFYGWEVQKDTKYASFFLPSDNRILIPNLDFDNFDDALAYLKTFNSATNSYKCIFFNDAQSVREYGNTSIYWDETAGVFKYIFGSSTGTFGNLTSEQFNIRNNCAYGKFNQPIKNDDGTWDFFLCAPQKIGKTNFFTDKSNILAKKAIPNANLTHIQNIVMRDSHRYDYMSLQKEQTSNNFDEKYEGDCTYDNTKNTAITQYEFLNNDNINITYNASNIRAFACDNTNTDLILKTTWNNIDFYNSYLNEDVEKLPFDFIENITTYNNNIPIIGGIVTTIDNLFGLPVGSTQSNTVIWDGTTLNRNINGLIDTYFLAASLAYSNNSYFYLNPFISSQEKDPLNSSNTTMSFNYELTTIFNKVANFGGESDNMFLETGDIGNKYFRIGTYDSSNNRNIYDYILYDTSADDRDNSELKNWQKLQGLDNTTDTATFKTGLVPCDKTYIIASYRLKNFGAQSVKLVMKDANYNPVYQSCIYTQSKFVNESRSWTTNSKFNFFSLASFTGNSLDYPQMLNFNDPAAAIEGNVYIDNVSKASLKLVDDKHFDNMSGITMSKVTLDNIFNDDGKHNYSKSVSANNLSFKIHVSFNAEDVTSLDQAVQTFLRSNRTISITNESNNNLVTQKLQRKNIPPLGIGTWTDTENYNHNNNLIINILMNNQNFNWDGTNLKTSKSFNSSINLNANWWSINDASLDSAGILAQNSRSHNYTLNLTASNISLSCSFDAAQTSSTAELTITVTYNLTFDFYMAANKLLYCQGELTYVAITYLMGSYFNYVYNLTDIDIS